MSYLTWQRTSRTNGKERPRQIVDYRESLSLLISPPIQRSKNVDVKGFWYIQIQRINSTCKYAAPRVGTWREAFCRARNVNSMRISVLVSNGQWYTMSQGNSPKRQPGELHHFAKSQLHGSLVHLPYQQCCLATLGGAWLLVTQCYPAISKGRGVLKFIVVPYGSLCASGLTINEAQHSHLLETGSCQQQTTAAMLRNWDKGRSRCIGRIQYTINSKMYTIFL